ncbi:Probable cytochrome P450 6a20 [Eumeta japonica]|uniref:unspecific monooxygenase n=1 Tax=Eumeta variegata TaxID=151549 RepID=A0A4C1ZCU7_EUMVA|nr:Probable cytochrome P450 6a20 [Eumeta japonica]
MGKEKEHTTGEAAWSHSLRARPLPFFVLVQCLDHRLDKSRNYEEYTMLTQCPGALTCKVLHCRRYTLMRSFEKFMPERFSPERIKDIKKCTNMPFGEGPRACVGERLGLTQSLAGLAALLHKYSVEPAPTTLRHPVSDPAAGLTQSIKGGVPLCIKARA